MKIKLGFCSNAKAGQTSIRYFFKINKYKLVKIERNKINDDIISFGVIRNPYSRCISAWKYCNTTRKRTLLDCLKTPPAPPPYHLPYPEHEKIDIEKTVYKENDWGCSPNCYKDCYIKEHDFLHFTLSQSYRLYHPITNKRVDHLLKFENLEEEIYDLCNQYGIKVYKKFPKINVGNYDHSIQLTSEEKEAIYNFYKVDFDTFGFKKE